MFDLPPKSELWLPPKPAIIRRLDRIIHQASLPGVFPVIVTGELKFSAWSFVTSSNSDVSTISVPSGTQVGDLIILFDGAYSISGSPTSVYPAGFTAIGTSQSSGRLRNNVSYKIAASGDIGATITGMTTSGFRRKILAVFRPDVIVPSVIINSLNQQATSGDPAPQNITASGGIGALLLLGTAFSGDSITETGTLVTSGVSIPSIGGDQGAFYEIQNGTKSDRTFDMPDVDVNCLVSFYVSAPP